MDNRLSPKARTWAEIDLAALKHNFELAKKTGKKVMCVIKADASGHGAVRCGSYLEKCGADAFAVACLSEALALREGGITKTILILGYTAAEYAKVLADNDITQTLVDESHANELNAAAKAFGGVIKCHIKIDSGMSRAGLFAQGEAAAKEAALAAERIIKLENLDITGMYTHFCVADNPCEADFTAYQLKNYLTVVDYLDKKGIRPKTCHTSNSAGILYHKEAHMDMVRAGIMLFGMYPESEPKYGPLKPVMSLKTRVSQVRDFPAGATISYGRTYKGNKPFTTAVMLAGYADGYPRRLSNSTVVAINGVRYPQAGRICMDMSMALVDGDKVKRGDEVTLIGGKAVSWEEVSQTVGTVNDELTGLVGARVPRVYINED